MFTIPQALSDIDDMIRLVWCVVEVYEEDEDWRFHHKPTIMSRIDELLDYRFKLMNP